jgi:tRNA(Ile)-lysidine synthase
VRSQKSPALAASSRAVSPRDFARALTALGPFESSPVLAVAVSGGADSVALALLAHRWAKAKEGCVVALTVDHGLRPEAGAEARRVARWMRARGVAHRTLRWRGQKPRANVQAAAREARYRLLAGWCARNGVLHLLTAHHLDDQAETLLLRLGRGSGLDGLSAMARVVEQDAVRVLRPLLDFPKARLRAVLEAEGQGWIEDPTNRNSAHARIRVRALGEALAGEGLTADRLGATARRLGFARAAVDEDVAAVLARAARLDPAGYVHIDPRVLAEAPWEVGRRALARVIRAVGGGIYSPRLDGLEALFRAMTGTRFGGRTLGGCRIVPWRDGILVCREAAAMGGGAHGLWDGRFRGVPGRARARTGLPGIVRRTMPPARQGGKWLFHPPEPLAGPSFGVV